MKSDGLPRKNRAVLFRVVTDREDVIEVFTLKRLNILRSVPRDIDSDLFHNHDRLWPHKTCSSSGAFHLKAITGIATEQPFRHLAASRVSRTKNEHALLHASPVCFIGSNQDRSSRPASWLGRRRS